LLLKKTTLFFIIICIFIFAVSYVSFYAMTTVNDARQKIQLFQTRGDF